MTPKNPPLYGLVLAGGKSRRMGRDKAALAYHDGEPHARRTAALLSRVCGKVFISRRADQAGEKLFEGYETIPDAFEIGGPLNGILSALASHPEAAFLVAACDLPFLSEDALRALVEKRDPSKPMTVFENPARDNFPEPLCAIYEPSYAGLAREKMAQGLTCPTKIAQALSANRLALRGPEEALFLANANTPEDYEKAVSGARASGFITVEYFALFRERAKRASEEIPLDGASLPELYERLRERHGFALGRASVHVAVNDAYATWETTLHPGDRLAFIPPVSGG